MAKKLKKKPTQEEIAARAYAIWEEEGFPHGRDSIHWELAQQSFNNGHHQAQPQPSATVGSEALGAHMGSVRRGATTRQPKASRA